MTYEEEISEYERVIKFLEETINDQQQTIESQKETIFKLDSQVREMAEESFENKEIVKKSLIELKNIRKNIKRI